MSERAAAVTSVAAIINILFLTSDPDHPSKAHLSHAERPKDSILQSSESGAGLGN